MKNKLTVIDKTHNIRKLQLELKQWEERNFGIDCPPHQRVLGALEEAGELSEVENDIPLNRLLIPIGRLSHAHLKDEQGIRGTPDEHSAAKQDAIGDITIYLMQYCSHYNWCFADIVERVAKSVMSRDWTKNKQDGSSEDDVYHGA